MSVFISMGHVLDPTVSYLSRTLAMALVGVLSLLSKQALRLNVTDRRPGLNKKQVIWLIAIIASLIVLPGLAVIIGVLWMCTVIARDDRSQ